MIGFAFLISSCWNTIQTKGKVGKIMNIAPFKLERTFARYEFSTPYLLSCSDCEPLTLKELLALADGETLKIWDDLNLGYTESQGSPLLREEVSRLYSSIRPEEVLILAPEEGIFIAMHALLQAGDHVISTFPGYQSFYEVAASLGCEVTRWLPREEGGRWIFDVDAVEEAMRPNTRLIVINFPHNPTGAMIPISDLHRLIGIVRRTGIYLFSDEMYRLLELDEEDRLPPACDLYENAVSLSGLSKSYALAGLRIGWLATRNREAMARMMVWKDYTTICNSAPSETLALIALRAREMIIPRNLNILRSNLAILDDFFGRRSQRFAWSRPRAGSVVFPRLLTRENIGLLSADLIDKEGVMLLPGDVFDYPGNYFRVGFGRRDLPQVLARFQHYLDRL